MDLSTITLVLVLKRLAQKIRFICYGIRDAQGKVRSGFYFEYDPDGVKPKQLPPSEPPGE